MIAGSGRWPLLFTCVLALGLLTGCEHHSAPIVPIRAGGPPYFCNSLPASAVHAVLGKGPLRVSTGHGAEFPLHTGSFCSIFAKHSYLAVDDWTGPAARSEWKLQNIGQEGSDTRPLPAGLGRGGVQVNGVAYTLLPTKPDEIFFRVIVSLGRDAPRRDIANDASALLRIIVKRCGTAQGCPR